MKDILISRRILKGRVNVPPSKSLGHRAIICAALAPGRSQLYNIGVSEDISATIDAMTAFGATIERQGSTLTVDGALRLKDARINCRESGSTIRFLAPLALHTNNTVFTGSDRLMERPLDIYFDLFDKSNVSYSFSDKTLSIYGGALNKIIQIDGNVSSQFISGLLFSLPLFDFDCEIVLKSPLESKAYVDLTLEVLNNFGIEIINNDFKEFHVQGGLRYTPCNYVCESDFSQAAFFLAAGALGSDICCCGLDENSRQGDREIINILTRMGAKIIWKNGCLQAMPASLSGVDIDASQIPDLVPVLAVLGSLAQGETRIYNAARLRIKESDRLATITEQLSILGANIRETEDGLIIKGVNGLNPGTVSGCNDHRIAMAMAVASTRAAGDIILKNSDCVCKSYPHFWEDFIQLGGVCHDWEQA